MSEDERYSDREEHLEEEEEEQEIFDDGLVLLFFFSLFLWFSGDTYVNCTVCHSVTKYGTGGVAQIRW